MAKTYMLKNIPEEVFKIVQKEQNDIKEQRGTNSFSFESTVYKMLRDYERCRKETKTFKPEPV